MKILAFLLFLIPLCIKSQGGLEIKGKDKAIIPFKLINNLIFIPVTINGVELTFLLDSGVKETLLFSLDDKEVNFSDVEKMKFTGLGDKSHIEGLLAINNLVSIGENYVDTNHSIYIILDESFNFSSYIGIPVNGIIGYQFFRNHPIKIDYINHKITVYRDTNSLKVPKRSTEIPISLELSKPYIWAGIRQTNTWNQSKLLIDLGNSDALWIFPSLIPGFIYNRPNIEDFLGRGFSGDIYGKRSRIHSVKLGDYQLDKPLAAMPDEYSIAHLQLVQDRKGSIGNETLRRFTVYLDYTSNRMWLRKNRYFNHPFHFNMSGLDVKHDGMFWTNDLVQVEQPKTGYGNKVESSSHLITTSQLRYRFELKPQYSIAGIRIGSPAFNAGLEKGDQIISINRQKTSEMTLDKINRILKSEEGKILVLDIIRKGVPLKISFTLEDPIPYQE